MLTKEDCVVGAVIRGVWDYGWYWEGEIERVGANGFTANIKKYDLYGLPTGDKYNNYYLSFASNAMVKNLSLVKKIKQIKSWSLKCQSK